MAGVVGCPSGCVPGVVGHFDDYVAGCVGCVVQLRPVVVDEIAGQVEASRGDGDLADAGDHVHDRVRAEQVRRQEPAVPRFYTLTSRWGNTGRVDRCNTGVLMSLFMRAALVVEVDLSGVAVRCENIGQ
jgi:hypothetical protein